MNGEPSVLVEELHAGGDALIGVITLNAPSKLNALSLDMIEGVDAALRRWVDEPAIRCVVLRGAGDRAFCAGGDIVEVAQAGQRGEIDYATRYFSAEYTLDHRIHTYPKPLVVFGNGIVMGGGIGLMAGASHRIVTPGGMVSMPEITIGMFPDVGASWFLNRFPGRTGLYCALTAARLTAGDAIFAGLADHCVPGEELGRLLGKLQELPWSPEAHKNRVLVRETVKAFAREPDQSPLLERLDEIQDITDYETLGPIAEEIERSRARDDWFAANAERFASGAPTAEAVIFEQLRRARHLSLRECFRMELTMAVQFDRHPDFPEGVRALLVDKDKRPHWEPATLDEVSDSYVAEHFAPIWRPEQHPLRDLGER